VAKKSLSAKRTSSLRDPQNKESHRGPWEPRWLLLIASLLFGGVASGRSVAGLDACPPYSRSVGRETVSAMH